MGDMTDGQVQFNMGIAQLQLISKTWDKATNAYLKKDYTHWFKCYKAIKLIIVSKLNPQMSKQLKRLEQQIMDKFKQYKHSLSWNDKTEVDNYNRRINNEVAIIIEDYVSIITKKLDEGGYLIPLKADQTSVYGQAQDDE